MLTKYKQVPNTFENPLLVWDGNCSFCQYWMLRFRALTRDQVSYEPYQNIAEKITGIPKWAFNEALRLIETDGTVYNGAHAAYQALTYSSSNPLSKLSELYSTGSFFRFVSDHTYAFISRHRALAFFITKLLWGKDPTRPKKYWLIYICALLAFITILLIILI